MDIVGPWAISYYQNKVNWGVVPVPTSKGSTGSLPTFSDAKNIAIYASCANQATAWNFLKFSTSVDQDGKFLNMTGQMPMRKGFQQDYAPYFTANPKFVPVAKLAANVVEVPDVPNSIQIWQTFRDAWTKSVIFGKQSPTQALQGAATTINQLVTQK